jgi:glycosyltransferase involved in cell wall biosynthesis
MISSAGFYGAERMVIQLSSALERAGCQTAIGVFHNQGHPDSKLAEHAGAAGLRAESIPCRGRIDRQAIAGIRALAESFGADIVHSHGYKSNIYSCLAMGTRGPRLVSTCHSHNDETLSLRLYGLLDYFLLRRRYHAVAAVSETVEKRLLDSGIAASKLRVIDNGIDCDSFAGAKSSIERQGASFLVGLVGRLVALKNPEGFLAAAREIVRTIPGAHFIYIGEGPERARLEGLCREWGLEKNVRFLGFRADIANVYASLDLFVLPSFTEAMPMSILECMAAGTPVLATRVGAVDRLVQDGETGLLIQPNDQGALNHAIVRLLQDRELAQRLSRNAQRWVNAHFSSDAMARNYLDLYRNVAAPPA